jgi:hypothetical protein
MKLSRLHQWKMFQTLSMSLPFLEPQSIEELKEALGQANWLIDDSGKKFVREFNMFYRRGVQKGRLEPRLARPLAYSLLKAKAYGIKGTLLQLKQKFGSTRDSSRTEDVAGLLEQETVHPGYDLTDAMDIDGDEYKLS